MNKDDNWWDAVGKNDWRERQIAEAETVEKKDKIIKELTLEIGVLEAMVALRDAQLKVMAKTPAVFHSNRPPKIDLILPDQDHERTEDATLHKQ
jgi:hypothetical protein